MNFLTWLRDMPPDIRASLILGFCAGLIVGLLIFLLACEWLLTRSHKAHAKELAEAGQRATAACLAQFSLGQRAGVVEALRKMRSLRSRTEPSRN